MKKIQVVLLILMTLVFASCSLQYYDDISKIKSEDYVGKEVRVRGEVQSTIKIASISGFVIKGDSGETISVSSEELPKEKDTITVKGVLIKDTIFGYYIKTN